MLPHATGFSADCPLLQQPSSWTETYIAPPAKARPSAHLSGAAAGSQPATTALAHSTMTAPGVGAASSGDGVSTSDLGLPMYGMNVGYGYSGEGAMASSPKQQQQAEHQQQQGLPEWGMRPSGGTAAYGVYPSGVDGEWEELGVAPPSYQQALNTLQGDLSASPATTSIAGSSAAGMRFSAFNPFAGTLESSSNPFASSTASSLPLGNPFDDDAWPQPDHAIEALPCIHTAHTAPGIQSQEQSVAADTDHDYVETASEMGRRLGGMRRKGSLAPPGGLLSLNNVDEGDACIQAAADSMDCSDVLNKPLPGLTGVAVNAAPESCDGDSSFDEPIEDHPDSSGPNITLIGFALDDYELKMRNSPKARRTVSLEAANAAAVLGSSPPHSSSSPLALGSQPALSASPSSRFRHSSLRSRESQESFKSSSWHENISLPVTGHESSSRVSTDAVQASTWSPGSTVLPAGDAAGSFASGSPTFLSRVAPRRVSGTHGGPRRVPLCSPEPVDEVGVVEDLTAASPRGVWQHSDGSRLQLPAPVWHQSPAAEIQQAESVVPSSVLTASRGMTSGTQGFTNDRLPPSQYAVPSTATSAGSSMYQRTNSDPATTESAAPAGRARASSGGLHPLQTSVPSLRSLSRSSSPVARVSGGVSYLGTRPRKTVHFDEWAEQLEFDVGSSSDSDDSVLSFTEEQLLEAQGASDFTTFDAPYGLEYEDVIVSKSEGAGTSSRTVRMQQQQAAVQQHFSSMGKQGGGGLSQGGLDKLDDEYDGDDCNRDEDEEAGVANDAIASADANLLHEGDTQVEQIHSNAHSTTPKVSAKVSRDDVSSSQGKCGSSPSAGSSRNAASKQQPTASRQPQFSSSSSSSKPVVLKPSTSSRFDDVPLMPARPTRKAAEYKLRLYTADRLGAGLPSGQKVHLEILGESMLIAHELPRAKDSFSRGCVDRFTLFSESGDMGNIEAIKIWHEPDGGAIGGGWCLDKVEIENKLKGVSHW